MVPLGKSSVLIAHYAPVTLFGLAALIQSARRFVLAGTTAHAPTARQIFCDKQPQLVISSLRLREGDGISLLKDFRKMNRSGPALVVSERADPLSVQRAFRAGARGYITTFEETDEMLQALELISSGGLYASPAVARALLEMLAAGTVEAKREGHGKLSDRELEVFHLIGRGLGTSRSRMNCT